jgi:hypothetical protein
VEQKRGPLKNRGSNNVLKDERLPHIKRSIIVLRIQHLVTAPIALIITVLLWKLGYNPMFKTWDAQTIGADVGAIGVSAILLLISSRWITAMEKNGEWPQTGFDWLVSLGRRIGLLSSVTTIGVTLAFLGGVWPIWMLIIISSGVLQILTYPSDKRLAKWQEEAKKSGVSSSQVS